MNLRNTLQRNKIFRAMMSVKIAVTCLLLLFILTLWGTIAQVQSGLYLAQERYFHSFFFLVFGFIPFPGAQLVMWVLFINLSCVAIGRFVYSLKHIGILIIHFGLLFFLFSGFVTLHYATDGHLTLREGQAANVSSAFHTWEIAIWPENKNEDARNYQRPVTAVDLREFKKDKPVKFTDPGFTLTLKTYYRNSLAYTDQQSMQPVVNASGIKRLEKTALELEPEKNTPGAIFGVSNVDGQAFDLLLYGAEENPTLISSPTGRYNAQLRLKRYVLPFTVKLIDFMMERHPGTDTARSFKSKVAVEKNGAWREQLISMNNPLRYKNYTFYQSSYMIDSGRNEYSTLAVVKNVGRLMPYIATGITFLGMVVHFVAMALQSRSRKKRPVQK